MAKQNSASGSGLPRLGGYELLGKVGKGGMGNVFKARQISMDRIVALKVLTTSLAKDKKFVERFHREAKAAAKLSHMNIIQSIDVGEEDGYHYFAMEYVQGPTVDDLLQKTPILKEDFCLDIILQIGRAIQAAEKLGIVHFDIKPSNIMITRDRVAKLADFGLARRVEEGATRAKQGLVFGTPEYMSPEQALGKPDVDSRSDIYSLGISFYQMVGGRLPFEGRTPRETVDLRLMTSPLPPKQLNPSLSDPTCQIIEKMLKRDRAQRYQCAAELIEDLEFVIKQRSTTVEARAAAGMQIDIPPEELGAVEQFRYLPRRRRKVAGPLFGLLCLAGLAGAIFYYVKHPDVVKKLLDQYKIQIGPPQPAVQQPQAPTGAPQPEAAFVPKGVDLNKGLKPAVHREPTKPKGKTHPKAQESYAQIMDMRAHKRAQNNYKELLKLYEMFPDNYKFAVEWEQLQALCEQDKKEAKKQLGIENDAVGVMVSQGKPREALARMEKVKERYPDDLLVEIEFEKKFKQIQDFIAKQAKADSAKRGAAMQEYMDAVAPAYNTALQGKYDDAGTKIDELALDAKFEEIQDVIKADKAAVGMLKEYMDCIYKGGEALAGKPFKVGGIGRKLVGVEGGAIALDIAGKQSTKKLSDLKPEELNQLAKAGDFLKGGDMGQLHLKCAIFYYFSRDMANAADELLKARDEGANIDNYSGWLKK